MFHKQLTSCFLHISCNCDSMLLNHIMYMFMACILVHFYCIKYFMCIAVVNMIVVGNTVSWNLLNHKCCHGYKRKSVESAASGFDVKSFSRQWRCRSGVIATIYKSILGSNIIFKTHSDCTHTSFEVVPALITLQHNTTIFLFVSPSTQPTKEFC